MLFIVVEEGLHEVVADVAELGSRLGEVEFEGKPVGVESVVNLDLAALDKATALGQPLHGAIDGMGIQAEVD